ncbi:MAG: hypothetical protein ACREXW_07610 [Gammaproteobacteria bacterium]
MWSSSSAQRVLNDRTLECLAFAEGRLLSIHPFEDFNGRLTRAFLAEILQRLDLPAVDPTPEAGQDTERYRQTLKAADRADWGPLVTVWRERFEKGGWGTNIVPTSADKS